MTIPAYLQTPCLHTHAAPVAVCKRAHGAALERRGRDLVLAREGRTSFLPSRMHGQPAACGRRPNETRATAAEHTQPGTAGGQVLSPVAECNVQWPEPLRDGDKQTILIDGARINFDYFSGAEDKPVVVFLQGFYYGRHRRAKANALEIFAKRNDYSFLVFDYYGTGSSEGNFEENGTLSVWIAHTMAILDEVAGNRPVVLCGAGIGGWIMLHVAQRRRNVVGLVGVNASVDFTEDLIRPRLSTEQKDEMERCGYVNLPWGQTSYPIGSALLDDSKQWLCLRGGPNSIPVDRPVRLMQGMSDEEVCVVSDCGCGTVVCEDSHTPPVATVERFCFQALRPSRIYANVRFHANFANLRVCHGRALRDLQCWSAFARLPWLHLKSLFTVRRFLPLER